LDRRLAAILAADVVDYSRLMGEDQARTLDALRQLRGELFEPVVSEHKGTVVKRLGDGWIVEFPSVSDAVDCALRIHAGLAGHEIIRLRTGIHIGDVVFENEDVFGDGVNVAARLEELANPGEVLISDTAHQSLDGKAAAKFGDGNVHQLKNIARPVQIWRWSLVSGTDAMSKGASEDVPLTLPDKPSIAVLPFDNMSGDPEQEYFADGIAEDVITALSRFRSLFVIARNSSFSYKGTSPDIRTVAQQLGVRYVVEGSVRKAGNRVRITAQLIDAATGNHLWADRFDGNLDDVFDLQDQITEQIVVAVEPEIGAQERERAQRRSTENLNAWELFQRALSHGYRINKYDSAEAIRLFENATDLDPRFAAAYGHLAFTHWMAQVFGLSKDPDKVLAKAHAAAEQALALDPNEAMGHYAMGRMHIATGDSGMAMNEMRAAVAINENFAFGHFGIGFVYHYAEGKSEDALPYIETALRLSPRDPARWMMQTISRAALRQAGRLGEAIAMGREACQGTNTGYMALTNLTASLARAGQVTEARQSLEKALEIEPNLSPDLLRQRLVGMHEQPLMSICDGLKLAGLSA